MGLAVIVPVLRQPKAGSTVCGFNWLLIPDCVISSFPFPFSIIQTVTAVREFLPPHVTTPAVLRECW
jgi:hypothetical protein